jgi:hypothetical protein
MISSRVIARERISSAALGFIAIFAAYWVEAVPDGR